MGAAQRGTFGGRAAPALGKACKRWPQTSSPDYRSPPFSRRSRALLSAFKRGLRRMLASDLVRALPNRCLRDTFFVRRSNVWPPSGGAGLRGPGGYNRYVESPGDSARTFPPPMPRAHPLDAAAPQRSAKWDGRGYPLAVVRVRPQTSQSVCGDNGGYASKADGKPQNLYFRSGRKARLRGSPREGPESPPLLSFHCERENRLHAASQGGGPTVTFEKAVLSPTAEPQPAEIQKLL